jgi:hypothetical protein
MKWTVVVTCLLTAATLLLLAQSSPTFDIARPTIVAFFAPVSESQSKEDAGDANEALTDFRLYGTQVRKRLENAGVDYKEAYASRFRIRVGDSAKTFRPAKAVGYYFVAPGKEPHVEYGIMTDADLLHAAHDYFGVSEK